MRDLIPWQRVWLQEPEPEPTYAGWKPAAATPAAPPRSWSVEELALIDKAVEQRKKAQAQHDTLRFRADHGDAISKTALQTKFAKRESVWLG